MDYIDIPDLQRRGILKKKVEQAKPQIQTENGYANLSPVEKTQTNPLSFLDDLANSSTTSSPAPAVSNANIDMQDLKVKLEDFEYKLERLLDRLNLIESKVIDFERKVT